MNKICMDYKSFSRNLSALATVGILASGCRTTQLPERMREFRTRISTYEPNEDTINGFQGINCYNQGRENQITIFPAILEDYSPKTHRDSRVDWLVLSLQNPERYLREQRKEKERLHAEDFLFPFVRTNIPGLGDCYVITRTNGGNETDAYAVPIRGSYFQVENGKLRIVNRNNIWRFETTEEILKQLREAQNLSTGNETDIQGSDLVPSKADE